MDIEQLQYQENKGWSKTPFPALDSERTWVIIFSAPQFKNNPEPLRELINAYPKSQIIGCSTAGEIAGALISDKSISAAIVRFDTTTIKRAFAKISSAKNSFAAGESIAKQLNQPDLQAVFILSTGLNVNGSALVQGINSILPKAVTVTGGLAGDGDKFKTTWIINGSEIAEDGVVALGFYGRRLKVAHGSKGGWDIFGPERRVTRSIDNVLYELDGKPALALYKQYLGDRAEGLPATGLLFPLAIRESSTDDKELVRTILSINEKDQSMTFAGDVPQGYLAKLMRANFDRLVSGANDAASMAGAAMPADMPLLCIAISCVGRRLLLGERAEEETEAVLDTLPKATQQIGFYSYGELSPYASGDCHLHNQTMTLTLFYEEK